MTDWMIKLKLRVKIGGMGIDIYRKLIEKENI